MNSERDPILNYVICENINLKQEDSFNLSDIKTIYKKKINLPIINKQIYFLLFILIFYINLKSVYNLKSTFTANETFQVRKKICSKFKYCSSCLKGKNLKSMTKTDKPFYNNVLGYGIPFISADEFKIEDCDCNKVIKVKKFCDDLDKSDPLLGLTKYDLQGILLAVKKPELNSKNFRFKQNLKNLMILKKNKKLPVECDCLNDKVSKSLFCQDKCKVFLEFKNKISSFYDDQLKETEDLFENEMKKYQ
jgi:hypothetical protein